jgi:hypothetical protein
MRPPVLPLWLWVLIGIESALVAFTLAASLVFVSIAGLWGAYPYPFVAWPVYLWYEGGDPATRLWLIVSAGLVMALALTCAGGVVYRRFQVRGECPLFGSTKWADAEDRERGGFRETRDLRR